MSKLHKQMVFSQVLILASLFWGVWLYADFLAHHMVSDNNTGFQWMTNRHFQFDWASLIVVVVMFGVGIHWFFESKHGGFKWAKSTETAKVYDWFGNCMAGFALTAAGLYFTAWLVDRNVWEFHDHLFLTRFWFWSMWWSVGIGWLFIAGVFCFVQANRLRDPKFAAKLKELTPQERYKDVYTKDLAFVRDELSLELARRGNDPSTDPEDLRIIHRSLAGRSPSSV